METPSDEVSVGSSLEITATSFDTDTDNLSLAWTTTGGQIIGDGETVTFDVSGLAPGPYTARAPVSDRRQGGTSQAEVTITVTP